MGRIEPEMASTTEPVGILDRMKVFIKKACTFKRNSAHPDLLANDRLQPNLVERNRKMVRDPREVMRRTSFLDSSRLSHRQPSLEDPVLELDQINVPSQISQRRSSTNHQARAPSTTILAPVAASPSVQPGPKPSDPSRRFNGSTSSAFRTAALRRDNSLDYEAVKGKPEDASIGKRTHPIMRLFQVHRDAFSRHFPGDFEQKQHVEKIRRNANHKPLSMRNKLPNFRLTSPDMANALEELRTLNDPAKKKVQPISETDLSLGERPAYRKVKQNSTSFISAQSFLNDNEDSSDLTPSQRNFKLSSQSRASDGQNKAGVFSQIDRRESSNQQGMAKPLANQSQNHTNSMNNPKLKEIARTYGNTGLEVIKETQESVGNTPISKDPNDSGHQPIQSRTVDPAARLVNPQSTAQGIKAATVNSKNAIGMPQKNIEVRLDPENSVSENQQSGPAGSNDSSQTFVNGTVGVPNSPVKVKNQQPAQAAPRVANKDTKQEEPRPAVLSFGPQDELPASARLVAEKPNAASQPPKDASQTRPAAQATTVPNPANTGSIQQPEVPKNPDPSKSTAEPPKPAAAPQPASEVKTGFFSMNATSTTGATNSIKGLFSGSQAASSSVLPSAQPAAPANTATGTPEQTTTQPAAQPTVPAPAAVVPSLFGGGSTTTTVPAVKPGGSFFGGSGGSSFFSGNGAGTAGQAQPANAPATAPTANTQDARPPSPRKSPTNPFLQPVDPTSSGFNRLNNILQQSRGSGIFSQTSNAEAAQPPRENVGPTSSFFSGANSSNNQGGGSSFFARGQSGGSSNFFNNNANRDQPSAATSNAPAAGSGYFSQAMNSTQAPAASTGSSFFGRPSNNADTNRGSGSFFGGTSNNNNNGAFQSRVDEERGGTYGQQSQAASNFFGASSSGQNRPSGGANNNFFGSSSGGANSFFGGGGNSGNGGSSIFSNTGRGGPEYNQHGQQIRRLSRPGQGGEKFW